MVGETDSSLLLAPPRLSASWLWTRSKHATEGVDLVGAAVLHELHADLGRPVGIEGDADVAASCRRGSGQCWRCVVPGRS